MPSKEVIQCHQITYDVQNQYLILHTKVRFDLISVFTRFHAVLRYSGANKAQTTIIYRWGVEKRKGVVDELNVFV